jgi:WD40 repeat protein
MKNPRRLATLLLCVFALSNLSPLHPSAQVQKRGLRVRKQEQPRRPPAVKDAAAADAAKPPAEGSAQAGKPRLVLQLGQRTMTYGFAAFSSDSRLLATGGGTDAVVWDVATGREVRRFGGNAGDPGAQDIDGLMGGAFSPDKRQLAVVAGPNLRLWNLSTGKLVWKRSDASNAFFRRGEANAPVAFSPDGRQIVVRGDFGTVTWDAATGRLAGRANAKAGAGEGVTLEEVPRKALSADGRLSVNAVAGVVSVTEKATGKELGRVRFKEVEGEEGDGLMAYALSPDGRLLLTADRVSDEEESVRLWDVRAGSLLHRLEGAAGDDSSFRFAADGALVNVSANGATVRARDMTGGREVEWKLGAAPSLLEVSADGRFVVTAAGRVGQVWDARTGAELARVVAEVPGGPKEAEDFSWDFAGFTPDETVTFYEDAEWFAAERGRFRLSTKDWKEKRVNGLGPLPLAREGDEKPFVMTRDARAAAWEIVQSGDGPNKHWVTVWNSDPDVKNKTFQVDTDEAYGDPSGLALSPDGRKVLVSTANNGGNLAQAAVKVWDADAKHVLFKLNAPGFRVGSTVAWSPDGKTLATGAEDGKAALWDASTGRKLHALAGHADDIRALEFSPDGRRLLTSGADGFKRLFDVATGAELCRLIAFAGGDWVVVDPEGRFDTNNLEELRGLHWVAPDDPLKPLPLELFMRDYYEPRLLARLLDGEKLSPVRSLAQLNRVQPQVRIASVEQRKDRPELVSVRVEVSQGRGETPQAQGQASGVFDLRLFRDGQLVAYAPEQGGEVRTDAQTGAASFDFENVRLPRRADLGEVEFTAYAFNADRVKSATARKTFRPADAPAPVKGRAYLISVGVNAYENPAWDLRFAANDARRLQAVVSERLARGGAYSEVVRVPLVSDYESKDGRKSEPRVLTEASATKANFRAVLDVLAGKTVDPQLLKAVPAAEHLRAAEPEDLVLISFSSHGYADERGNFYLLPSDTGPGGEMGEVLGRSISSEELSAWLRDVDAGEMLLVVDACHSAASVQGAGFKPGPMGSRGLGQLSYDKGMRILTSTQADDVALESNLTQQGLLTYALTRDGIERGRADFKPKDDSITVSEWLAYGVERVPVLHAEVEKQLAEMRAGRAQTTSLGEGATQAKVVVFRTRGAGANSEGSKGLSVAPDAARSQQPSLFDFARRRRAAVLSRTQ